MMKRRKIGWILVLLLGIISFMSPGLLASKRDYSVTPGEAMDCKASLKQFSLRLEASSKQRTNQAYYQNLYQQTQDFLNTLENFPISSSQLGKCENFLTVIQGIVGSHAGAADLAPMPDYPSPQRGKLAKPVLETAPKRPLRPLSIRYVYGDPVLKHTKETDEEAERTNDFKSSPTVRLSKTRKLHISKETQDLE